MRFQPRPHCRLVALVLSLALCAAFAQAAPLLIDIGPTDKNVAKGYVALSPEEAYSAERGFGWVPEPGIIRFCYSENFRDSARWKRDATQVEGTSRFFSANKRYQHSVGALPKNTRGSFVYAFRFPAPIETLHMADLHVVWGHKPVNKVTMWTSPDGTTWTVRHQDPAAYHSWPYSADLSTDFRGKTALYVRYEFVTTDPNGADDRANARLDWFALGGTLRGELPASFDPKSCIATLSGAPCTAGVHAATGDDLTRDGATIVDHARFRADLPAGRYYVEAVSDAVDYAILRDGTAISAPNRPPWRTDGTVATLAGRVDHAGGALNLAFQSKGELLHLYGLRILTDRPAEWPARIEAGKLVLARETQDRAALDGVKQWEAAGGIHTPELMKTLLTTFEKVKDPDLRASLIALGGFQPNAQANAPETKQTIAALQGILKDDPLNITARDLLDDIERILKGDKKYSDYWWADVPGDSLLQPVLVAVKGRYAYNEWAEGGRTDALMAKCRPLIEEAMKTYPNDTFLRMYHLERVPWGAEYQTGAEGAPRWAALQRELNSRILHVIDWWTTRQRKDGSFGGGLNDDVEMLRGWPLAILAHDDDKAIAAARRMSDGIWNSGALVNGYSKECWDIQHSSEESSDTQPQFIGVCYGDPEWISRNMLGLSCMRDVWTAINPRGYRHFKSCYVSATEIDTKGTRGVDVPYATRAVKSGHWLTWYAPYPEAVSLMTEWSRAWAAASMRTDDGKPAGVPPAAVDFETGRVGGKGKNWYQPDLRWTYFDWPGMVNAILEQMLLAYSLTGDEQYVRPFPAMLDLVSRHMEPPAAAPEPGTEAWVVGKLIGREVDPSSRSGEAGGTLWSVFGKWRILTGDARYDDLLKRVGDAYIRFYLTGDTAALETAMENAMEKGVNKAGLGAMRYNLPMLTTEVKFTDRIFIGGHGTLYAMFTGAPGDAQYCPAHAVTWKDATRDFAALVERADRAQLRVRAYNFDEKPKKIGMTVWRLARGKYRLSVAAEGATEPAQEVTVSERGQTLQVTLPSRRTCRIEMTLVAEDKVPAALPDLAVNARDIKVEPAQPATGRDVTLSCLVHNIGAADAPKASVRFIAELPDGDRTLGECALEPLPRPQALKPSTRTASVQAQWPGPKSIRVEIVTDAPQITRTNDRAEKGFAPAAK